VSAAREHLAELIETVSRSGEPVYVTRRGRRVAVILHPDVYERLIEEAEDAIDRAELRAAREARVLLASAVGGGCRWRGCVVGEGAGAEPAAEGPGQCGRAGECQASGAERLGIGGAAQVQVDECGGVGAAEEVLEVAGALGAELGSRAAQDQPICLARLIRQGKAHHGRRPRDLVDVDELGGRP
jgi:prevent-host-death family protein